MDTLGTAPSLIMLCLRRIVLQDYLIAKSFIPVKRTANTQVLSGGRESLSCGGKVNIDPDRQLQDP